MIEFASAFAGVAGFDLPFEELGMRCTAQIEVNKHRQKILHNHFPHVPQLGDIQEVTAHDIGRPDLIVGGSHARAFPMPLRIVSDLTITDPTCSTTSRGSSRRPPDSSTTQSHDGLSSRTAPDSWLPGKDGTWTPSSGRWRTLGMGGLTESWTRDPSVPLNVDSGSSFWLIAEETPDQQAKCWLSPKHAGQILEWITRDGHPPVDPRLLSSLRNTATG